MRSWPLTACWWCNGPICDSFLRSLHSSTAEPCCSESYWRDLEGAHKRSRWTRQQWWAEGAVFLRKNAPYDTLELTRQNSSLLTWPILPDWHFFEFVDLCLLQHQLLQLLDQQGGETAMRMRLNSCSLTSEGSQAYIWTANVDTTTRVSTVPAVESFCDPRTIRR